MAEEKGPFEVAVDDLVGANTEKTTGTITDEQGNEKKIETETEKSWNDKIKPDSDSDDNN